MKLFGEETEAEKEWNRRKNTLQNVSSILNSQYRLNVYRMRPVPKTSKFQTLKRDIRNLANEMTILVFRQLF